MIKCTAENCNSIENNDSSITFHKYPLFDKKLLTSWLENIAPPDYQPQPDDYICSLHFTDDQFLNAEPRRLIRNALPTIHADAVESNINSCETKSTNSNKEYESEECSADSENVTSETDSADEDEDSNYDERKRKKKFGVPRYVGDFKEDDLRNPEKMKRMWELAYKQISEQKNKLKTITQRNRRLEGQVTRLKNVIKHLKTVHK